MVTTSKSTGDVISSDNVTGASVYDAAGVKLGSQMSDARDLVRILVHMQAATKLHIAQVESHACKLFTTGPGNASIDGTPQYLGELQQQLNELSQALTLAHQWARP